MGKRKLTEAQVEEICRRYQAGENTTVLAIAFDVTPTTICRRLEAKGIPRRSISEAKRQYTVDHSFFSAINTQKAAYILGFISADGHLRGNVMQLILQRRDRQHLHRLLQAMRSNYPTRDIAGGSYKKGSECSRVDICSAQIACDLRKHGVISGKGFTLRWPSHLQPDLLRHYLRGFVDANGGFYAYPSDYARPTLKFAVCSNCPFLLGAQSFLMERCQLARTKLNLAIKHSGKPAIAYLQYGGRHQVSRIFHLLYDGATIWLPRKRDRIEPYID